MHYGTGPSLLIALACVLSVGCGGGGAGDEVAKSQISGTVTLGGQMLEKGSINFLPTDGIGPTASGVITSGKYQAEVPHGVKRVEITAPKVVGQRKLYDTPDSPMTDITEELVPKQYNTESKLTVDIKPDGEKTFDFPLETATTPK